MKTSKLSPSKLTLVLPLLVLMGCGVSTYRDTIATSYGYLNWSQATYKTQCQATPNAQTCALITRGIGLHNAAVDALNAYCNGPAASGSQSWTTGGPCSPVKSLQGALEAALANLNVVIVDVKLLATGKSQPKLTAGELLRMPSVQASLLRMTIAQRLVQEQEVDITCREENTFNCAGPLERWKP